MTTLTVHGMSCDGCEDIVETALEEVAGVETATADRDEDTAEIEGDADHGALLDAIEFAGYEAGEADAEAESAE
jgi:copper chaperone